MTSRDGSQGSGRSRAALTTLKIAVGADAERA
jgi:hypothetical protein